MVDGPQAAQPGGARLLMKQLSLALPKPTKADMMAMIRHKLHGYGLRQDERIRKRQRRRGRVVVRVTVKSTGRNLFGDWEF